MKVFTITILLAFFAQFAFGAVQNPTAAKIQGAEEKAMMVTWAALLTGNTGAPVLNPTYRERIVQASGTFGGATVVMEGSNDGTNWVTLTDTAATPANISFTATGIKKILMTTKFIRPNVSGGAGAAIDINLLLVKP